MLDTYIKNQGVTQTIVHDNNNNHFNQIKWDIEKHKENRLSAQETVSIIALNPVSFVLSACSVFFWKFFSASSQALRKRECLMIRMVISGKTKPISVTVISRSPNSL